MKANFDCSIHSPDSDHQTFRRSVPPKPCPSSQQEPAIDDIGEIEEALTLQRTLLLSMQDVPASESSNEQVINIRAEIRLLLARLTKAKEACSALGQTDRSQASSARPAASNMSEGFNSFDSSGTAERERNLRDDIPVIDLTGDDDAQLAAISHQQRAAEARIRENKVRSDRDAALARIHSHRAHVKEEDEDEDSEDDDDDEIDVDSETDKTNPGSKSKKKNRKKTEIQPHMLKALRKEASKNREARTKYTSYLKRHWEDSAKITKAMELLTDIQAKGEKTIVFSQWTSLLDLIEIPLKNKLGIGYCRYDGGMSPTQRNNAVQSFVDDSHIRVMLCSLRAGNAGLNLTVASRVIIMDPFWNPYIEMQAVDRAHRIGQVRPVQVHRILVEDTIEDRIMQLQQSKRDLVDAALDEVSGRSRHTMADLTVSNPQWKTVEVGRVVVTPSGSLAAIVEIIDHKRALVDGPASDETLATPRGAVSLANVLLTPITIAKLTRGARTPTVKKVWESEEVEKKWAATNWAKKREQQQKRKALTDFERFKVLRLKKQRRFEERKALAKVKASVQIIDVSGSVAW
ncbi:hypothetical protein P8C59_009412 [Phyllachora maydis]|uniref:Helicase C-terminal domain-containing protein n=1 Tax=Phyllachora maydis TaxID=1825666 RepID=A0AAD9MG98_9PEZI|nr:hypothetical protein P8C59_009412 [Phyllachora maydis]